MKIYTQLEKYAHIYLSERKREERDLQRLGAEFRVTKVILFFCGVESRLGSLPGG